MNKADRTDYKDKFLKQVGKGKNYLPTLFLISSNEWSKPNLRKRENQTRQTLFTDDFLVIKHGL